MAAASSSLRRLLLSSSKARLHARPLLASMAKKNAAMAFCTEAPPPRKMARTPSGPVDGEPVRAVWTPVEDEKTGGIYWWNEETDETTEVGAPKPSTYNLSQDPWEEVKDPHTGQVLRCSHSLVITVTFMVIDQDHLLQHKKHHRCIQC
uniref:WW domain-containing protein n=1 Tax=Lotharella globosa TaxID=91324 RepID=A0A7S4DE14_9EUKA